MPIALSTSRILLSKIWSVATFCCYVLFCDWNNRETTRSMRFSKVEFQDSDRQTWMIHSWGSCLSSRTNGELQNLLSDAISTMVWYPWRASIFMGSSTTVTIGPTCWGSASTINLYKCHGWIFQEEKPWRMMKKAPSHWGLLSTYDVWTLVLHQGRKRWRKSQQMVKPKNG